MNERTSRRRLLIGIAAAPLVAAACGGSRVEVSTGDRPNIAPAQSAGGALPSVTVWNVRDARWEQFADRAPTAKPLLLWFWAPHCPSCARQAPEVTEFHTRHGERIDVVGIGTQDDADQAREFVDRHGVPFPMLWDETFDSWRHFNVTSQPTFALLGTDGRVLGKWPGRLDTEAALRLI